MKVQRTTAATLAHLQRSSPCTCLCLRAEQLRVKLCAVMRIVERIGCAQFLFQLSLSPPPTLAVDYCLLLLILLLQFSYRAIRYSALAERCVRVSSSSCSTAATASFPSDTGIVPGALSLHVYSMRPPAATKGLRSRWAPMLGHPRAILLELSACRPSRSPVSVASSFRATHEEQ